MVRRTGSAGVAAAIVCALAPAVSSAQLNGHGSTGLRTCDLSGCKATELVPVGLPIGVVNSNAEGVICLASTKLPVEDFGELGVCDPPPVFGPGYDVNLVRADVAGHKASLKTVNLGSALISEHAIRAEVDGRYLQVETVCSYQPPDPSEEDSFCVP